MNVENFLLILFPFVIRDILVKISKLFITQKREENLSCSFSDFFGESKKRIQLERFILGISQGGILSVWFNSNSNQIQISPPCYHAMMMWRGFSVLTYMKWFAYLHCWLIWLVITLHRIYSIVPNFYGLILCNPNHLSTVLTTHPPMKLIPINIIFFFLISSAEYDTVRRRKFYFRWRGPPDSSVSSLILVGWCEEGHPATKNLLQLPQG